MGRTIISKTVLDTLIRTKLAGCDDCAGVEALPVAPIERRPNGCNWAVPGWVGDRAAVDRCREAVAHYLSFLASHFDIPDASSAARERDKKA